MSAVRILESVCSPIPKVSTSGLKFIIQQEGFSLEPYNSYTGEDILDWNCNATIGVKHKIKRNDWKDYKRGITDTECVIILTNDLKPIESYVYSLGLDLTQHKFDMLVSLCFDIGVNNFRISNARRILLGQQSIHNLEDAWLFLNRSHDGRVKDEVAERRMSEYKIFTDGYSL